MNPTLYVSVLETPEEKEAVYRLRYEVYCHDYHYLESSECPEGIECDAWDAVAYQFGIRGTDGQMLGTARLIPATPLGFPTGQQGIAVPADPSTICEFSRLAFHRLLRGQDRSPLIALLKAMLDFSREHGIRYWFGSPLSSTWRLMLKVGIYFELLGEPVLWSRAADDGVVIVPAVYDIETGDAYLHRVNPSAYSYLYAGHPGTAGGEAQLALTQARIQRDRQMISRMQPVSRSRRERIAG